MHNSSVQNQVVGMLRIRRFEEKLIELHSQGAFPGHYHVYIGQEATATAACAALTGEDMLFSTWRNHGHLLARGADPGRLLAEILGRADGYCRGKGGTLHAAVNALGAPATSALVGGNAPLATGAALGLKHRRTGGIAVVFFGDGALEEGAVYEAFVLAGVWRLPILFVCENNSIPPELRQQGQFPSSTHPAAQLMDVPNACRVPAEVADGADAEGLIRMFSRLVQTVRNEGSPRFVEIRCTRWPGSVGLWPALEGGQTDIAWAFGGRPEQPDYATWVEQSDPFILYLRRLAARGALTRSDAETLDRQVRAEMDAALQFAQESPFPPAAEAYAGVYAEGGDGR